jgi:hypothetical protein
MIDAATTESMDTSVAKYVNGRADIAKKSGAFGQLNLGELNRAG